ncbi:MAG: TRAP transporter small permease [Clostridiales bacterium]
MKFIISVFELLNKFIVFLSKLVLVIMLLTVSLQVTVRLFNYGFSWTEELARLTLTYFVITGMAIGVRERIHINIEIISKFQSPFVKKINNKIIYILTFGMACVFFWYGIQLIMIVSGSTLSATGWPAYTWYLAVPFSGLLIAYYSIIDLFGIKIPGRPKVKEEI